MNKLSVLLIALLLVACASAPDPRPQAVQDAAHMIESGRLAYRNDEFRTAVEDFSAALGLYRGMDDRHGATLARVNLAQAALAVGEYDLVRANLSVLEHDPAPAFARRVALLRASLSCDLTADTACLNQLDALLPAFAGARAVAEVDDVALAALARRAQVAVQAKAADAGEWVGRFAEYAKDEPGDRARLLRLRAGLAANSGDQAGAMTQLEQALDIYRASAARPGIAATLEEQATWADNAAERIDALHRALTVRIWMRDRAGTATDLRRLAAVPGLAADKVAALQRWAGDVDQPYFSRWSALDRALRP